MKNMWPTPDTQNHRDGTKRRKDRDTKTRHGESLHHTVARIMSETSKSGPPRFGTQLTLFAADSPASPSVSPASAKPKMTNGGSGPSSPEFLASFDPDTWLLKTSQACVLEGWQTFSETLPKSGMMRSGRVYRLPTLAHHTEENESGLWPTPTQDGNYNRKGASPTSGDGLATAVMKWPTPRQFMHKDTNTDRGKSNPGEVVGGSLNPTWVEWLQGFPMGWTEVD